jgi:hypothetical protein
MLQETDNFYLTKTEPNRSCLLALRKIILDQDAIIIENSKYGMPCFCYKNKVFCYLWTDKKTEKPYILMVEGKLLKHPKLKAGNRAKMKNFNVNPNLDLPIKEIQFLISEALNLYKNGTIKTKD